MTLHHVMGSVELASTNQLGFVPDFPVWSSNVLLDTWEPMLCIARNTLFFFSTNIWGVPACLDCPSDPIIYRAAPLPFTSAGPSYLSFEQNLAQSWAYLDTEGEDLENADTVAVSDPQGNLYVTFMQDWSIAFQSSSDLGQQWSDPITVSADLEADKNWMTLNPQRPADIFVTFNAQFPYSVHTLDGGDTWSVPVLLESLAETWAFACGAVFRPSDATAFYAYALVPDGNATNRSEITYSRAYSSSNYFATHQTYDIQQFELSQDCPDYADCSEPEAYLIGGCGMAIDAAERVYYIANAASPAGLMRIMLSALGPAAPQFSAPADVSDAPQDADIFHAFPFVATGKRAGDVRVAWMDNRTGDWNLWYRQSADGGQTWTTPSVRLSHMERFGFQTEDGFLFPYGDYGSMIVDSNDNTHIIWGEGYGIFIYLFISILFILYLFILYLFILY